MYTSSFFQQNLAMSCQNQRFLEECPKSCFMQKKLLLNRKDVTLRSQLVMSGLHFTIKEKSPIRHVNICHALEVFPKKT